MLVLGSNGSSSNADEDGATAAQCYYRAGSLAIGSSAESRTRGGGMGVLPAVVELPLSSARRGKVGGGGGGGDTDPAAEWLLFLAARSDPTQVERGLSDTFAVQLSSLRPPSPPQRRRRRHPHPLNAAAAAATNSRGTNGSSGSSPQQQVRQQLGFTARVARLDQPGGRGWQQQLQLQYLLLRRSAAAVRAGRCWCVHDEAGGAASRAESMRSDPAPAGRMKPPPPEPPPPESAWRACGLVTVGVPQHGSRAVRAQIGWRTGLFPPGTDRAQIGILVQPRNQGWARDVADVHVVVLTGWDLSGFNVTVRRADTLGEVRDDSLA
jgi:hypothetical protein